MTVGPVAAEDDAADGDVAADDVAADDDDVADDGDADVATVGAALVVDPAVELDELLHAASPTVDATASAVMSTLR